jgi:hypothetical protein
MSRSASGRSHRSTLALALAAFASLSAFAAPAAADVIIVDPAGGGDATDLSTAVASAQSGDVLILRPSDYTLSTLFLDIQAKALVIAGDPSGTVTLPPLFLNSVPAGGTFVLRHLVFQPNSLTGLGDGTILINNSAGNVHIEDCTINGFAGSGAFGQASPGKVALRLSGNTGAIAIHRSVLSGGVGKSTAGFPLNIPTPSPGGAAINAQGGRLALFDVVASGGNGGDGFLIPAMGAGGAVGIDGTGCDLILSGATVTGGEGGNGTATGVGGIGIDLLGGSLRELDSTVSGGTGAPALDLTSATHELWPGQAWQLALGGPLPSGEQGSIAVSGPPNCLFGLFVSGSMGYQVIGKFKGPFLPGAPFFGPQFIASTNGSGTFAASFLAPSLVPFGLESLAHVDQALMVQPVDGLVLGSASAYIQYQR